jgi:hypothetical protein
MKIKTTRRLVASMVLGSASFAPNVKTFVDMSKIPPFVQVGMKSMLMKLEFQLTATMGFGSSGPAVPTLFLKYLLDTELWGPGNYVITSDRRGWHDSVWQYMQRGRIDWIKGADIPASTSSATRTWTQEMDFEEPNLPSQIARCWPIEAFRAGGAGLYIKYKTPVTIKGATITTTALTLNIYAHVFDMPAAAVSLPLLISEFATKTNTGDINPSPGIGQYLRTLMALSPVPADNDGTASDDLSPYTQIDYYGLPNAYTVYQQPVTLHMQDMAKLISTEQPSQLNTNTNNKSEFRLLDPQQNFDGAIRAIPLVWPDKGRDITAGPIYNDKPQLGVNGNVTAGLPANFWFMNQRIDPRTDAILNATVSAMTSASTGQTLLGRVAAIPKAHNVPGVDKSRVPLLINAS